MSIVEQTRETAGRALKRPSAYGALAVNLIPIFGVLFFGWSAPALMYLYWIENLVVGAFNVARMGISGAAHGKIGFFSTLFLIPFFILHYGLFCFVHGVFVLVMFSGGGLNGAVGTLGGPFEIDQLVQTMIAAQPVIVNGIWAMLAWQAIQFVVFYLGGREFKTVDPFSQMFAPYGRIIILHFTIMLAGLVVMFLGQPLLGVLALALLKTAFDVNHEARDKEAEQARENWDRLVSSAQTGFKEPLDVQPSEREPQRRE
jgi:hypothetical protein